MLHHLDAFFAFLFGIVCGAWYGAHRAIYVDQLFYRAKFWVERKIFGNVKKHWRW